MSESPKLVNLLFIWRSRPEVEFSFVEGYLDANSVIGVREMTPGEREEFGLNPNSILGCFIYLSDDHQFDGQAVNLSAEYVAEKISEAQEIGF